MIFRNASLNDPSLLLALRDISNTDEFDQFVDFLTLHKYDADADLNPDMIAFIVTKLGRLSSAVMECAINYYNIFEVPESEDGQRVRELLDGYEYREEKA